QAVVDEVLRVVDVGDGRLSGRAGGAAGRGGRASGGGGGRRGGGGRTRVGGGLPRGRAPGGTGQGAACLHGDRGGSRVGQGDGCGRAQPERGQHGDGGQHHHDALAKLHGSSTTELFPPEVAGVSDLSVRHPLSGLSCAACGGEPRRGSEPQPWPVARGRWTHPCTERGSSAGLELSPDLDAVGPALSGSRRTGPVPGPPARWLPAEHKLHPPTERSGISLVTAPGIAPDNVSTTSIA